MGIIKGGLLFFIGIFLLISLIAMNIFLTMNASLSYENVKANVIGVAEEKVKIDFNQLFLNMQTHCQNNSEYLLDTTEYTGSILSVPCSVAVNGQDSLKNYIFDKYIEEGYYKKYDCHLLDCPSKSTAPMVYFSQHARDYWKSKFYISLLVSLVLIALMFLLIEKKTSIFSNVGILIIISSLPLFVLNWLSSFSFAELIFSKSKLIFWIVLISGIVLVCIGIFLSFWKFKGDDKEVSKKEVKSIVKEEISKQNVKKK